MKDYINSINSTLTDGDCISYDAASAKAEYIKSRIKNQLITPNLGITHIVTSENKNNLERDIKDFNFFKVDNFVIKKSVRREFIQDGYVLNHYSFYEIKEVRTQYFSYKNETKLDVFNDPRFDSLLQNEDFQSKINRHDIIDGIKMAPEAAVVLFKYMLKLKKFNNFI